MGTVAIAHPSPWKSLLLSAPALLRVPMLVALPRLPPRAGVSTSSQKSLLPVQCHGDAHPELLGVPYR